MADEKVHVFSNSVKETLRVWPVLTLARQHGFCGADYQIKEEWLCESIIQIFKDNDLVYPDELEDFVSEALYNEFDTIVEDGSLIEVCTKLCGYYDLCKKGNVAVVAAEVQKMQATQPKVEAKQQKEENESESSEDDDDDKKTNVNSFTMDVDMDEGGTGASSSNGERGQNSKQKEYDEDGWEIVRRSKKR